MFFEIFTSFAVMQILCKLRSVGSVRSSDDIK